jgi:hypothetical protein
MNTVNLFQYKTAHVDSCEVAIFFIVSQRKEKIVRKGF